VQTTGGQVEVLEQSAAQGVFVQPHHLRGCDRGGLERGRDRLGHPGCLSQAALDLPGRDGCAGQADAVAQVCGGRPGGFGPPVGGLVHPERHREPVDPLPRTDLVQRVHGGLALGDPVGAGGHVDAGKHPLHHGSRVQTRAQPQEQRLPGQGTEESLVQRTYGVLVLDRTQAVGQAAEEEVGPHRPAAGPAQVGCHGSGGGAHESVLLVRGSGRSQEPLNVGQCRRGDRAGGGGVRPLGGRGTRPAGSSTVRFGRRG